MNPSLQTTMLHQQFELKNAANTVENSSFQLQNVANSKENERFQLHNVAKTVEMAVSNSKMLQLEKENMQKKHEKTDPKKTKWKKDNSHNMSGPFFLFGMAAGDT